MKSTVSILLILFLSGCQSDKNSNRTFPEEENSIERNKIEELTFEDADDILTELRSQNIDSIIVFERICSECEFRTIFWVNNGQAFSQKSSDNSCLDSIPIIKRKADSAPFLFIMTHLKHLKSQKILDNSFLGESGKTQSICYIHHCYSSIEIMLGDDTISSGRMKDSDFEFDSGHTNSKGENVKNFNFKTNIGSDWFKLLQIMEERVLLSGDACELEKEAKRKNEDATNID